MLNELVATPTAKSRSNCDETPDLPRRKKIFTAIEPLANGIENLVNNPRREKKQDGKEKRTMVLSETKKTVLNAPSGVAPPPASCLTQTAETKVEDRQLVPHNPLYSLPAEWLNTTQEEDWLDEAYNEVLDDIEDEMVDRYLDAMLDENANEDELWDLMNLRRKYLRRTYYAYMHALVEPRPKVKQNGKDQEDGGVERNKQNMHNAPPPSSCLTQSADPKVEVHQLSPSILIFWKDPYCLSSAGDPNPEDSDRDRVQQRDRGVHDLEQSKPHEWTKGERESSYPPDPGKPPPPPPAEVVRRGDVSHHPDPPDPGG